MDFDGSRYYTLNRVMLSTIGLWPYQKAWPIRIQRFSCVTCVISCIIVQVSLLLFLKKEEVICTYKSYHNFFRFTCFYLLRKIIYFISRNTQFQLLTFTTFEYNLDLFLQVLTLTIPCLITILKYVSYCVKIESVSYHFQYYF